MYTPHTMNPSVSDLSSAKALAQSFLPFLQSSPSPYHVVKNLTNILLSSNHPIQQLSLTNDWKLSPDSTYTVSKGGFMATFHIGKNFKSNNGAFNIIASHTDSPCLKLSYNHSSKDKDIYLASVQCYGGGLWNTWLDRGLGFAGKVMIKSKSISPNSANQYMLEERLINVAKPVFFIPNLAIHLRKSDERLNFPLDLEKHIKPVLSTDFFKPHVDECPPLLSYIADHLGVRHEEIINFDLSLYDTHNPELGGLNDEFIQSARLDNLVSCYISLKAFVELLDSNEQKINQDDISVIIHYNYEEVGSLAGEGADSCTTTDVLRRILYNLGYSDQNSIPVFARSFVTSIDMAHAVNPLYPERHQRENQPQLQRGIVIKSNPNRRYATDLKSTSLLELLCQISDIPHQHYRVPNTSPCGSTIGPFLSSKLGCDTVDVGIAQFAMHSIREMCGIMDLLYLLRFTKSIINNLREINKS